MAVNRPLTVGCQSPAGLQSVKYAAFRRGWKAAYFFVALSVWVITAALICKVVSHPCPGIGVAEKRVGVESEPIGLYTHAHDVNFSKILWGSKIGCNRLLLYAVKE